MIRARLSILLLAAVAILAPTAPAAATQHLVRPGSDWSKLQSRLRPGDEIILMPGKHRAATITGAHGTAERPIVIRSLDPQRPATVSAERYGLRLVHPRHVHIRDIVINGATIGGVTVAGIVNGERGEGVILENLTVTDTGPRGLRHAISIERMKQVRVRRCRVEGWGGFGLEVVASEGVDVESCSLVGRDGYGQLGGIRLRAGTDRVRISGCRFSDAGEQGVVIGGASKPEHRAAPIADDAKPGSLAEATGVQVEHCVFIGGDCAVALASADRCSVRQNTIFMPRVAVISLRRDQADERFLVMRHCTFGNNLIVWEPDALDAFAHMGDGANAEQLYLEQNLWWSAGGAAELERLGAFPGARAMPQITELDPELDARYRPQVRGALTFGAAPLNGLP